MAQSHPDHLPMPRRALSFGAGSTAPLAGMLARTSTGIATMLARPPNPLALAHQQSPASTLQPSPRGTTRGPGGLQGAGEAPSA